VAHSCMTTSYCGMRLGASRGLLLDETGLGGAHNALVNVLLDAGIVGVVVWALFLTALVRYLLILRHYPNTRTIASTLLGATTVLLVSGLTVEFLVVPATISSTWLFMIVGWTLALIRDVTETKDR
jgi:exopolysaccharide production protein ExoQ